MKHRLLYRLEEYSWRTQEDALNATLPQFRIGIKLPSLPAPCRIHFIHIRSPHEHAIPLLLLPPFPFTNFALAPLLKPLTDPEDAATTQAFHVVIPALPGLGFSDAFPHGSTTPNSVLEDTSLMFNVLMTKLGYGEYLCSSTGSGSISPANVDYHIPRLLATKHAGNCLGIHIVDPPVPEPSLSSFWIWTKYSFARFFHAPVFGYTSADWKALSQRSYLRSLHLAQDSEARHSELQTSRTRRFRRKLKPNGYSYGSVGLFSLRQPCALAYALCDSPVGLLTMTLSCLRRLSPEYEFTNDDIINFTSLAWLPGPEAAMRFYMDAEREIRNGKLIKWCSTPTTITTFTADDSQVDDSLAVDSIYVCPAWAETRHKVVWTSRREGRGGLVAWENRDAIIDGVNSLAREVIRHKKVGGETSLEEVVIGAGAPGN